jgi:hypothetical protein
MPLSNLGNPKQAIKQSNHEEETDNKILETHGLYFYSSKNKPNLVMTEEWNAERSHYLTLLSKQRKTNFDFVQQGIFLFESLEKNSDEQSLTTALTLETKNNYISQLKSLETFMNRSSKQTCLAMTPSLQKSIQSKGARPLTHQAENNHLLQTDQDNKKINFSVETLSQLNDLYGSILLACPPRIRKNLSEALGFEWVELEKIDQHPSIQQEIATYPDVIKPFIRMDQKTQEDILNSIHLFIELLETDEIEEHEDHEKEAEKRSVSDTVSKTKSPRSNPLTSATQSSESLVPLLSSTEEIEEEIGRGNLTDQAPERAVWTKWVYRLDRFARLGSGGVRRFLSTHPKFSNSLPYLLSLVVAMLYQVFYKMLPFEVIRTYGGARISSHLLFSREVSSNHTKHVFSSQFRPGEWTDVQGKLITSRERSNTLSGLILFSYGFVNLIVYLQNSLCQHPSSPKRGLGLLILSASVLSILLVILLGVPSHFSEGILMVAELFNVLIGLLLRVVLESLVFIRGPAPQTRFESALGTTIYLTGQIIALGHMKPATAIAAGVYGDQAAYHRIIANSLAEVLIPISTFTFRNRWEGFSLEPVPWWRDETPQLPNPNTRRTGRLLKQAGGLLVHTWDIYALIFVLQFFFHLFLSIIGDNLFLTILLVLCGLLLLGGIGLVVKGLWFRSNRNRLDRLNRSFIQQDRQTRLIWEDTEL